MKGLFVLFLMCITSAASCQKDSTSGKISKQQTGPSNYEQLYRMNHASNMMIGGGVGLYGVSAFLIYDGVTVYNTGPQANSTNPNADIRANHTQGIIFFISAAAGIAGGAALITFGALRKYQFKVRKRAMGIKAGLTPSGRLLLALNF